MQGAIYLPQEQLSAALKTDYLKVWNMNNKTETLLSTDGKIKYGRSQRSSV